LVEHEDGLTSQSGCLPLTSADGEFNSPPQPVTTDINAQFMPVANLTILLEVQIKEAIKPLFLLAIWQCNGVILCHKFIDL